MDNYPPPRKRTRSTPITLTASSTSEAPVDKSYWKSVIVHQPLSVLKSAPRQFRQHSKADIADLAANIDYFGVISPIVISRLFEIIDGQAVFDACKLLGHETIPTVIVDHLDDNQVRALRLALNKFSERSVWDAEALAAEFAELFSVAPELINFYRL